MKRVAIVGLGLIGGSIARALRERKSDVRLLAVDRPEVGAREDVRTLVSEFIDCNTVTTRQREIQNCDLVVLSQPARVVAETVSGYLAEGTVVTDTGSTKRVIVERAESSGARAWFVPGHPMAGKERGGFENADPRLFEGRPWILCPEGCDPSAVARVRALVDLVGAKCVTMSAEAHDASVAVTSHVPQLISSWLYRTGVERNALDAAGPVFLEMTRTAGGPASIWRDIFDTNADEVGRTLRELAQTLTDLSDALLARPRRLEAVLDFLERARAARRP